MGRKRHKPEEIVAKLRQVDVLTSQGQSVPDAISLKRSTPNLQLSTSRPADYPIFGSFGDMNKRYVDVRKELESGY